MALPLAGWRLPLRLAARDIRRYKGRSALAALLIFLPVFVLTTALIGISTFDISTQEEREAQFQGVSAHVTFDGSAGSTADGTDQAPPQKVQPFPAAGRTVSPVEPPTAAQVAKQAGRPAVAIRSAEGRIENASGGPSFAPVALSGGDHMIFTDPHSPVLKELITLVDGRLPSKAGEVAITDYGTILGVPARGKISLSAYGAKPLNVTVVGRVRTTLPNVPLVGATNPQLQAFSADEFLLGGSTPVDKAMVQEWARYGATVTTPDSLPASATVGSGDALPLAIATAAFITVVAMLAGPAFAAGSTRHRRTLGLFAVNGARRTVLRRIVLGQALTLGALTATIATVLGAIAGTAGGMYIRIHRYGFVPPVDLHPGWLAGIIVVSTIASLVAALVPARAAGKTNLLSALRGQVSPRKVSRKMPAVGIAAVIIGCVMLYLAVGPVQDGATRALFAYVGTPLFFGGATMTVPYVLRASGALATHLPVVGRIAVRDVSRQRTRATASIGAVLATVAVCASAAIVGTSLDHHEAKGHALSFPKGSGGFVTAGGDTHNSDADTASALARIRAIAPDATAWWSTSEGLSTSCSKYGPLDSPAGLLVSAVDDDGIARLNLTATQRSVLERGGVVVLSRDKGQQVPEWTVGFGNDPTPPSARLVKNGRIDLRHYTLTENGDTATCRKVSLPAASASAMTVSRGYNAVGGSLLVKRSTLKSLGVQSSLGLVTVPSRDGITSKTERQLRALAPTGLEFHVERGYTSPMSKIITGLTAALALLVLLTTVVSTLLKDAESRADAATLATVGAPRGMRRRITGAHAAAIGFIGAVTGVAISIVPSLIIVKATTGTVVTESGHKSVPGTYVIPWWPLLVMLIGVPLLAAIISMTFARRTPGLTRREA